MHNKITQQQSQQHFAIVSIFKNRINTKNQHFHIAGNCKAMASNLKLQSHNNEIEHNEIFSKENLIPLKQIFGSGFASLRPTVVSPFCRK